MNAFPKFERYKDSGVEWLGDVPEHWEVVPNRALLTEQREKVGKNAADYLLLSLTLKGVIPRDMENPQGKFPAEFNTYTIVKPNDLVFCHFDIDETPRAVGHAAHHGMITGAYNVYSPTKRINAGYLYYYYLHLDEGKRLKSLYSGLRKTIQRGVFGSAKAPLPPKPEQDRIVVFLDQKTAEIDALIAKKQRQIELLDEQKAILINRAVTRGLNPKAKLKPSGIEWIGEIPEHWEVKKIKYLSQIFRGKFTHRPRNDPSLYDGPYPFVQTGDVARANIEISSYSQTLNEKGLRVSTLVPKGTIAITIAANIGDVAILGFDACFPDSVVGFLPGDEIQNLFFFYILKGMKAHFLALAPKNTQHNLNVERVGGESLTVPPRGEQEAIIAYIETLDARTRHLATEVNREIESLKTLRSTLIAHAVTGRIKV